MMLVALGGVAAATAMWFELALLPSIAVATAVVVLSMQNTYGRVRLAPLLVVLAGVMVTLGAASPAIRAWF